MDSCMMNGQTVCVDVAKHLGITFTIHSELAELSGPTVVDTLCPVYFNNGVGFCGVTDMNGGCIQPGKFDQARAARLRQGSA